MPTFTNIQALQGCLLDASSLLLHVATAGGRHWSWWMVTIAHSLSFLKVWMLIFRKFQRPLLGLDQGSIWTGRSRNLGFMNKMPSSWKEPLPLYWKVAGMLRKPRAKTTVVRYTDLLSHPQSSTLMAKLLSAGASRYLMEVKSPPHLLTSNSCRKFTPATFGPLGYEQCHNPVWEHCQSFHLLVMASCWPGSKTVGGRH